MAGDCVMKACNGDGGDWVLVGCGFVEMVNGGLFFMVS